jgi:hypothetical protein
MAEFLDYAVTITSLVNHGAMGYKKIETFPVKMSVPAFSPVSFKKSTFSPKFARFAYL